MKHTRDINLTQENLHTLFEYDNGLLRYKTKPNGKIKIGQVAGSPTGTGYWRIKINTVSYRIHRIIWVMFNGSIDKNLVIDHKNGDPLDNRIENLNLVTCQQNLENQKAKGYRKCRNKYRANIMVNRKNHELGYFNTEQEARMAYLLAKKKYHTYYRDIVRVGVQ